MKKSDIMEKLTEAKVEFDPNATVAELTALLPAVDPEAPEPPEAPEAPKETKKPGKKEVDPAIGDRDVEVPEGHEKKVVTQKELKELEAEGRLFGYKKETKEASFKKAKK